MVDGGGDEFPLPLGERGELESKRIELEVTPADPVPLLSLVPCRDYGRFDVPDARLMPCQHRGHGRIVPRPCDMRQQRSRQRFAGVEGALFVRVRQNRGHRAFHGQRRTVERTDQGRIRQWPVDDEGITPFLVGAVPGLVDTLDEEEAGARGDDDDQEQPQAAPHHYERLARVRPQCTTTPGHGRLHCVQIVRTTEAMMPPP